MRNESFGDVLALRAESHGDRGFTYLNDGESEETTLSYNALELRARAIAALLTERGLAYKPVLLLFPSGLDFIASLFGCFYSGAVAVPLAPPNPARIEDELRRMAILKRNAGARVVLTTQEFFSIFQMLPSVEPELLTLEFIVVDEIKTAPHAWQRPRITSKDVAFLQYTSGSTGTPKGVMVTHGNILENARLLKQASIHDENSHFASWLPMYHDFGLIGGILHPLYLGSSCTILSPLAFLQRPVRWLWAISRKRARMSGGPNFGYELCVRKVTDDECQGLDLSEWIRAFCAAEPIRAETLERFSRRFAPYGFSRKAWWCGYGLAESTLLVTGGPTDRGMKVMDFSARALEEGKGQPTTSESDRRTFVALGPTHGATLTIVSPDTGKRCPDGVVGEIWINGPSVAAGYHQRPEETAEAFGATLEDFPDLRFLRTGDLGFIHEGELFVTGRLKDLLIFAGRNHYPQDIEHTVDRAVPGLRPGCSAAISIDTGHSEELVVVAELSKATVNDFAEFGATIRRAVAENHGLAIYGLLIVSAHSVPKTSSGKLQRRKCRAEYLDGKFEPIWRWTASAPAEKAPVLAPVETKTIHAEERIESALRWLTERIATLAELAGMAVDPHTPLMTYGLDSVKLVGLSGEFSERLGKPLSATFFFDHPTLAAISQTLRHPQTRALPVEHVRPALDEPIAIVGMACRFPGGITTPDEYWRLLEEGRDAIEPFPADRWDVDALYDPDPAALGKTYCKHGGFLRGLDQFDAAFFGIAPREADAMEPQQRLLLETVWEALENAAISPSSLAQSPAGVYVGTTGSDYRSPANDEALLRSLDGYAITGQAPSVLAGRIAYTLNLRGPALTVDTACSSSLVALHMACQALRARECEMAIAAGVTVMNTAVTFVDFSRMRVLSPDGRCKSFGADADGVGWSEGCGVLLLKRLSDANRHRDRILAVIRGTAVNQDGRSQGLTAPNGPAQEDVIRQALVRSGLAPNEIDAIEAHGTGTKLGDPIEAGALASVFGAGRTDEAPLLLGSCKSNLGHTQAAAGIAGVMKMVLALQHEALPRTLHALAPSTNIAWETSGLRLLNEARPWPRADRIRRAGVSSFGISGTNAHVLLEEAPTTKQIITTPDHVPPALPLPLSGRTPEALREAAVKLQRHLQMHPDLQLVDIAYSLATTRSHFEHRAVVVARDRESLLETLAAFAQGTPHPAVIEGKSGVVGKVAFVFPGQGSQWVGMTRSLVESSQVFCDQLRACERALARYVDWSLLAVLRGDEGAPSFERVDVIQPVLFAIMVSLAALWRSMGIEPETVAGHSQGEIAAACVAGALSLEDGAKVVALRSRALARLEGLGAMAAIELPAPDVEQSLASYDHQLSIAAINGPTSTVVSGAPEAVQRLLEQLEAAEVFARRVQVSYASHCAQVDSVREELLQQLTDLQPQQAHLPLLSTVTLNRILGPELNAQYWFDNVRQPVRFADAISALVGDGHRFLIEVSPHPVLTLAMQTLLDRADQAGAVAGTLRRDEPEWSRFLLSLGTLYTRGLPLDWSRILPAGKCINLPTYPFQRQRHWLPPNALQSRRDPAGAHPLIGKIETLSTQTTTRFGQASISVAKLPWLGDHLVRGAVVFPGAGFVEMSLAAGEQAFSGGNFEVADVVLMQALSLRQDEVVEAQTVMTDDGSGLLRLQVASRPAEAPGPWTTHAQAVVRKTQGSSEHITTALEAIRIRRESSSQGENPYERLKELGLELGPAFRGIEMLWSSRGESIGRIRFPEAAGSARSYRIHPTLLDSCFQALAGAMLEGDDGHLWIPVEVRRLRLHGQPGRELWCHARIVEGKATAENRRCVDLVVTDSSGALILDAEGLLVQRIAKPIARKDDDQHRLFVSWRHVAMPPARKGAGSWLVVGDGDGLATPLRRELEAAGHRVVTMAKPIDSASNLRGFIEAEFGAATPTGIVYLCALEVKDDAHSIEPSIALVCDVLHTVQSVSGTTFRNPPRLWPVTRGAQAASPGPVTCAQAPLMGLGRAIAMEHAELRCSRLDLDPARPASEAAFIAAELLADDVEDEVAHRQGSRLVPRLVRDHAAHDPQPVTIHEDATYLITGGLGGLGLSVAGWLASKGAKHLLLVGRSGVTNDTQRSAIAALEALGVSVTIAALDVADRSALADLLKGLPADRPLRGVVHAAGLLDDGLLMQQTPARFRKVLGPKAVGAWNLHILTRSHELDFFVLYSSLAGVLGSPGQSNYAAASTFLDALAHHRRAQGLPAVSIDWGPFSDVGLAAAGDTRGARLSARGLRSLTPEQGLVALAQVLEEGHTQVTVALLDARQWVESYPVAASSKLLSEIAAERSSGQRSALDKTLLDRIAAAPRAERSGILEDAVAHLASSVLRVPPNKLDRNVALTSLGVDSLMGLELRNRLEATLGISIPATLLWTYPTITELSRHLVARLSGEPEPAALRPPPARGLSEPTAMPAEDLAEDDVLALLQDELGRKRSRR